MHKQQQLSELIAFSKTSAKARESLGDLQLLKYENNFYVAKEGKATLVKPYDVDPLLKKASTETLIKYLEENGYIQIDQLDNQDYVLKAKGKILGGGPGGATAGAIIGKYGTYAVCHGGIIIASAMTGWGFFATFASLEAQFAASIEVTSNSMASAGCIIGALVTGPA